MKVTVSPGALAGTIPAIASKSYAHRLFICAALAKEDTVISCRSLSDDISATLNCLTALGTGCTIEGDSFTVHPGEIPPTKEFFCGESGSTYRFLLPIACALGMEAAFYLEGRLPVRPMDEFFAALEQNGAEILQKGSSTVLTKGALAPGKYALPGNISSQYITGLLFALPLLKGDSEIEITTAVESRSYLNITLSALRQFGITVTETESGFSVPGNQAYRSPGKAYVEGDWSNAAFFLSAGALSEEGVTLTGLNLNSDQGDKAVLSILRQFGAEIQTTETAVTVKKGTLHGIAIDAGDIPDLIPVLAAVAAAAEGTTRIYNAGRLRYKESDRLAAIVEMLTALGGKAVIQNEELLIEGCKLRGGVVDSQNDHRIAMTAAVAAAVCKDTVTIHGAEAVNKSYPDFFLDLQKLQ